MMDVYGAAAGKRANEMLEGIKIASLQEKDPMKLLEKIMVIYTNASIAVSYTHLTLPTKA